MSRPFGSKNGKHKKITPKNSKSLKKRGRGRPKGSKNKNYKVIVKDEVKRGRGRPKNPVVIIELPPASIIKKSKFIGYCPKCSGMVCKGDLESKFIFVCSCGNRDRIKTLKKVVESERF